MTPEQLVELNETVRADVTDVAARGVEALRSVTTDLTLEEETIGVGLNWSGCAYDFEQEGNPPTEVNWTYLSSFVVEGTDDLRDRTEQAAEAFIQGNREEWAVTSDSANDEHRRLRISRPGTSLVYSATLHPDLVVMTVEAISSCTPVPVDTRERWPQWS